MKKGYLGLLAIMLLLAGVTVLTFIIHDGGPAVIPEASEFERLLAGGRPVLIFFTSQSCEQCKLQKNELIQLQPEFDQAIKFLEVDVNDRSNRLMVQEAGVMAVPTLIFLHPDGNKQRFLGVMEAEKLRDRLREISEPPAPQTNLTSPRRGPAGFARHKLPPASGSPG